jgi:hypothetical protein
MFSKIIVTNAISAAGVGSSTDLKFLLSPGRCKNILMVAAVFTFVYGMVLQGYKWLFLAFLSLY